MSHTIARVFGVLLPLLCVGALADELRLPDDPAAPSSQSDCAALYREYRAVIESLRARAEACNARRAQYVQERYGHHAGRGECARRTIAQCRGLVEDCTTASEAAAAALDRCHAAISAARSG